MYQSHKKRNLIIKNKDELHRKKIKLEQEIIKEKIYKKQPLFDIKEHEVQIFILIFQELLNQIKNRQKVKKKQIQKTDSKIY